MCDARSNSSWRRRSAQWIVYDPANTIQSVINTAQEMAKFVEMINNQAINPKSAVGRYQC
jgi:hypothetical protein